MCELGAYNMDMALVAGQQTDHLPVGEIARSILAPSGLSGRRRYDVGPVGSDHPRNLNGGSFVSVLAEDPVANAASR